MKKNQQAKFKIKRRKKGLLLEFNDGAFFIDQQDFNKSHNLEDIYESIRSNTK